MSTLLKLLYLLVAASSCFNFGVGGVYSGLDSSWLYILNRLFIDGTPWGSKVIFTYGPLGFLVACSPVGNLPFINFVFWSIIAVCSFVFFWYILFSPKMAHINSRKNNILASFVMLYLGVILSGGEIGRGETAIPFLVLSLLACSWTSEDIRMFLTACILTAVTTFTKFNVAAECYISIAVFAVLKYFSGDRNRNKYMLILCSVPIIFCICFLLYNPSLTELYHYINGAYEISSGYILSMSMIFSAIKPSTRLLFYIIMFIMIVIICIVFMMFRLIKIKHSFSYAALFFACMFVAYKHSFVRLGTHSVLAFVSMFMVYASVYVLFMKEEIHISASAARGVKACMYVFFVGTFMLCAAGIEKNIADYVADKTFSVAGSKMIQLNKGKQSVADLLYGWLRNPLVSYARKISWFSDYVHNPDQNFDKRAVKTPENFLSLVRTKSTAVYPMELSYIYDFPDTYKTMPVFQAYSAYTSWLDGLNADFFRDDTSAPHYVIFSMAAIDNRFALLECPSTWLELFRNYKILQTASRTDKAGRTTKNVTEFLLERKDPENFSITHLSTQNLARDEIISVPEVKQHCVMKLDMPLNLLGQAAKVFWKVPPVEMEIEFRNGEKVIKRVLPTVLANNTLISSVPLDDESFTALMNGDMNINRVKSIRFLGDGLKFFSQNITVTFSELNR